MWDRYQQAVLDFVANDANHLVVQARAGSGKTAVVVAGLELLPPQGTSILCAYNTTIAEELKNRAPSYVAVKTLHGLGFQALKFNLGRRKVEYVNSKGRDIAFKITSAYAYNSRRRIELKEAASAVAKLSSAAKNHAATSLEDIESLAYNYGYYTADLDPATASELAVKCLQTATADPYNVDFDDMIYLPAKLGLSPIQYDFVVVDEAQDVNPAQLWLTRAACRTRYLAVGDSRQVIYGFRGADTQALGRTAAELSAHVLPLSVTYRCSRAIVDHVRHMIPGLQDFEARPDAPDGEVVERDTNFMLGPFGARPDDFILSRLNEPLVKICLALLKNGIPAVIAGRDFSRGLSALLRRSGASTPNELRRWLNSYTEREIAKAEKHEQNDAQDQLETILDQAAALRALSLSVDSISELQTTLDTMFNEEPRSDVVTLSTVHKAKGLERNRVWLLSDTFNWDRCTHDEENTYYVGCTRARTSLYLVNDILTKERD